jgi:hypothetical protein
MTRAFLLTNLDTTVQPFKFQVALDIIGSSIPELGRFPYRPGERSWHGNTLFVKGAKSKYINKNNIPIAKEFFPGMSLETLDAGHWGTCKRSHLGEICAELIWLISSRRKVRLLFTLSVPCVLC